MKRIFCLLFIVVVITNLNLFAQNIFFVDKAETLMNNVSEKRVIIPNKYKTISLDLPSFKNFLTTLPSEEIAFSNRNTTPIIELPMPDGTFAQFNVWESNVMELGLANNFPTIKTYAGQGITDKAATIRFDMTEMGFHAMILSPFSGSIFIDPYDQRTTNNYISYYKKDFFKKDVFFELPQLKNIDKGTTTGNTSKAFPTGQCIGNQRRNYRLAIACTYQYAQTVTGLSNPTKAQVLAKIVTTINRVTGIYEQEVGIHFNLVANNQNIIYTTAANDTALGQYNNDPYSLVPKSHSHISLIIGSSNFDLGQTFSTGAGGLVITGNPTGVACDNDYKASAATGQLNPIGDAYDVDFVAHELGHQFNSNHTFNANKGDCFNNTNSYSASTATNCEPGSGSTIMAYAGICDSATVINNLQPHSDPQFHSISIAEILDYSIQDIGNNCPTITATGNNAPMANAGADYTIPINTPFILTGTGSDPDNDAISYSWEQIDVFGAIGNWNATQTANIPLFRSFTPKLTGVRYLPQISDVVNATTTIGERLPSISRTMKFRLTVRDNKAGGGGTCFDDATITVNNTGGAFAVTSQNTNGIVCIDGETRTVTWSKGGTSSAPFNVVNVAIELSTDGGYTFPVTLVASTTNDGSENIIIPANFTTTARIRVRALNNIFYAINTKNFTIKVNPNPVKWLSIAAQKEKNKTVKINWIVNEIENSFYDVERSTDGNKFEKIINIPASKENGYNHSYIAIDSKPVFGKNYYRIKQVDKDGHYTYSIIVFVILEEANNSVTIYPNPATTSVNLFTNASYNKVAVKMFDAIGKVVYQQIHKEITKGSTININISNLPKGVYSISVIADDNEAYVKKLIVQ